MGDDERLYVAVRDAARIALFWVVAIFVAISVFAEPHVKCEQPPEDWIPKRILSKATINDAIKDATQLTPEMRIEIRREQAYDASLRCQIADAVTTIVAIEWGGAIEGNPALKILNSDDSNTRYLGYAAFIGLKYGLIRLARSTPTTADDWILAGSGCGSAAWNLYQMTK